MGLHHDVFEFDSAPPSRERFLDLLRAQVGDTSGLVEYNVAGGRVEVMCALNPYTRSYACVVLMAEGGRFVNRATGRPCELGLPAYTALPWTRLSRGRRLIIWLRWYLRLDA